MDLLWLVYEALFSFYRWRQKRRQRSRAILDLAWPRDAATLSQSLRSALLRIILSMALYRYLYSQGRLLHISSSAKYLRGHNTFTKPFSPLLSELYGPKYHNRRPSPWRGSRKGADSLSQLSSGISTHDVTLVMKKPHAQ